MKKKSYIVPSLTVVRINTQSIICTSPTTIDLDNTNEYDPEDDELL